MCNILRQDKKGEKMITDLATNYLSKRGYYVTDTDYQYYYNSMRETFFDEQYRWLMQRLKPHTIAIDMGAQIGDSAIYMLQHGIKRIVCYEPEKVTFRLLEENLREKAFCMLYNEKVPEPYLNNPQNKENVIIKCDVEGAEHRIFTEKSDLSFVYRIQIEYHHGPQKLPEVLKDKSFMVKVEKPRVIGQNLGEVGWIYAWK